MNDPSSAKCFRGFVDRSGFVLGEAWRALPGIVQARRRIADARLEAIRAGAARCRQSRIQRLILQVLLNRVIKKSGNATGASSGKPRNLTNVFQVQLARQKETGIDYVLIGAGDMDAAVQFQHVMVRVMFRLFQARAVTGCKASVYLLYHHLKSTDACAAMSDDELRGQLSKEYGPTGRHRRGPGQDI